MAKILISTFLAPEGEKFKVLPCDQTLTEYLEYPFHYENTINNYQTIIKYKKILLGTKKVYLTITLRLFGQQAHSADHNSSTSFG